MTVETEFVAAMGLPNPNVGVIDNNHRYSFNGAGPYPGVTAILKLQDALMGDGLTTWAAKIAAEAVYTSQSESLDLAIDDALHAVTRAQRIGSAVHGKIEDLLSGRIWQKTPETEKYLDAFSLFMAEHHPEFIEREAVVLSPKHNYAGRFDFIAKIAGRVALVDVKTGKLKASHTLQLAGYAAAEFIGRPNDPTKHPLPRIKDFYILLLRENDYTLQPITVTAKDRRHFLTLAKAYQAAKAWETK